jgi:uncharacterized protein (DUF2252 family)
LLFDSDVAPSIRLVKFMHSISESGKDIRSYKKSLTREQLHAAGKALRDKIARSSHASSVRSANEQDTVDMLIESSKGRLTELVPIRYGRMMQSPFAFYRGAASIMAADLDRTPSSGILVQICGDCHLMNFGGFATPERRVIFDINDFDETHLGPWEWDVKRLATSIVIAGRNNRFGRAETRQAAVRCVQSYREHLKTYTEMHLLQMWYQRIDVDAILASMQSDKWKAWKKNIQDRTSKATSPSFDEHYIPKMVTTKSGKPQIKDSPPLIFHQSDYKNIKYHQIVTEAFSQYRKNLTDDRNALLDHYEIKDVAIKVVGIGSVGMLCAILLLMTADNDVLFLQVKEARASVLEPYAGKSNYSNHGQRVVTGQRLMQSASDIFLGWTRGPARDFYIRQLHDIKIKPRVEMFDTLAMGKYAEWCGWALARSHAKSGNAAMITGYLGNSNEFDEAIANFALAYADQNELDYQTFLKAIRAGKIEVNGEH